MGSLGKSREWGEAREMREVANEYRRQAGRTHYQPQIVQADIPPGKNDICIQVISIRELVMTIERFKYHNPTMKCGE
jgi:hypothetical protein